MNRAKRTVEHDGERWWWDPAARCWHHACPRCCGSGWTRDIVHGDPEPCCENPIRTLGWRTVRRARRTRRRELRRLARANRRLHRLIARERDADLWSTPILELARLTFGPFLDHGLRFGVFVNPVFTLDGVDWSP